MSGQNAGSPTSWAKPQQDQKSIRPGAHAINANTAAAIAGDGSDMEDEGQSTGSRMPSGKHAAEKEKKRKTTPSSINSMVSQVLYWAAQCTIGQIISNKQSISQDEEDKSNTFTHVHWRVR